MERWEVGGRTRDVFSYVIYPRQASKNEKGLREGERQGGREKEQPVLLVLRKTLLLLLFFPLPLSPFSHAPKP